MLLEIRTTLLLSPLILVLDTQPLMARLFASVPTEVNVILIGLHPMRQATCVRAYSIALKLLKPNECCEDGFP